MKARVAIENKKRRELRREVGFCCPICGCPILEYHHIIPWSEIKKHDIEHMIALCPTCHAQADNKAYTRDYLYKLKSEGCNSPGWKHALKFDSDDFYVQIGDTKFEKPRQILTIDRHPMLSVYRLPESNIILDTWFFDKSNILQLSIVNNELRINTLPFWDIEYNGRKLTIRKKPRDVIFQLEFNSKRIWFRRGIYYFGTSKVEFMKNEFTLSTGKTFFRSKDEKVTFTNGHGIFVNSEGWSARL